jgi:hypothetical protein
MNGSYSFARPAGSAASPDSSALLIFRLRPHRSTATSPAERIPDEQKAYIGLAKTS